MVHAQQALLVVELLATHRVVLFFLLDVHDVPGTGTGTVRSLPSDFGTVQNRSTYVLER